MNGAGGVSEEELRRLCDFLYRHTGMLFGALGTAMVIGEVRGLVALAVMATAFYFKASKEERWLAREFGPRFDEHRKHTGMFLPGI